MQVYTKGKFHIFIFFVYLERCWKSSDWHPFVFQGQSFEFFLSRISSWFSIVVQDFLWHFRNLILKDNVGEFISIVFNFERISHSNFVGVVNSDLFAIADILHVMSENLGQVNAKKINNKLVNLENQSKVRWKFY